MLRRSFRITAKQNDNESKLHNWIVKKKERKKTFNINNHDSMISIEHYSFRDVDYSVCACVCVYCCYLLIWLLFCSQYCLALFTIFNLFIKCAHVVRTEWLWHCYCLDLLVAVVWIVVVLVSPPSSAPKKNNKPLKIALVFFVICECNLLAARENLIDNGNRYGIQMYSHSQTVRERWKLQQQH